MSAEECVLIECGGFSSAAGSGRLRLRLRASGDSREIATEYAVLGTGAPLPVPGCPDDVLADAALAAGLLPAMKLGLPLRLPAPGSPELLGTIDRIQERLGGWWPQLLRQIAVQRAPAGGNPPPAGADAAARGVGLFFSGGVDSFYSLFKHLARVDFLVVVHGFDVPLANAQLWNVMEGRLTAACDALGKRMIRVRTNLRELLDRYVPWDVAHGAAMAHVAILLSPILREVIIASSFHHTLLFPFGSHPEIDPFWSTGRLSLVHDGCEATRIEKTRAIAGHPVVRATLRVCWKNPGNAYNCGYCRKCLITMLNLDIAGALDACSTFARRPAATELYGVNMKVPAVRTYFEEICSEYRRIKPDSPYLPVLEHTLHGRASWVQKARHLAWRVRRRLVRRGC